jgi:hypothetical protein
VLAEPLHRARLRLSPDSSAKVCYPIEPMRRALARLGLAAEIERL